MKQRLGNAWRSYSLITGVMVLTLGVMVLYTTLMSGSLELWDMFAIDAGDPGSFTWWRAVIYIAAGMILMRAAIGNVDRLDGKGRMTLGAAMVWVIGLMDLFSIIINSVLAAEESGDLFISSLDQLMTNLSPPYPFSLAMLLITLPMIVMAIRELRSDAGAKAVPL